MPSIMQCRIFILASLVIALCFAGCHSYVRQSIAVLTPAQITTFRNGVAVMKSKPTTDPTSWQFQANMHGTFSPWTGAPPNPWNKCQHGTLYFVSWHRMFLYYFERILRKASGDDNFALPYWNYTDASQRFLPEPFRNPADATNPLYTSNRGAGVNDGTAQLDESTVDTTVCMADIQFDDMTGDLEQTPHNVVHGALGGWMGSVPTSAQDPIFWLHHANIDRLWNDWINSDGGRADPSDSIWLNTVFNFYDENGTQVTMTGSQVLNTITQLNYKYDDTTVAHQYRIPPITIIQIPYFRIPLPDPIILGLQQTTVTLPLPARIGESLTSSLRNSAAETTPEMDISFNDLVVKHPVNLYYEVYLNLPKNMDESKLGIHDRHYIGNLNFFGRSQDEMQMTGMDNMKMMPDPKVRANKQLQALMSASEWKQDSISLTFIPHALKDKNDRVILPKEAPSISIGGLSVQLRSMSKDK